MATARSSDPAMEVEAEAPPPPSISGGVGGGEAGGQDENLMNKAPSMSMLNEKEVSACTSASERASGRAVCRRTDSILHGASPPPYLPRFPSRLPTAPPAAPGGGPADDPELPTEPQVLRRAAAEWQGTSSLTTSPLLFLPCVCSLIRKAARLPAVWRVCVSLFAVFQSLAPLFGGNTQLHTDGSPPLTSHTQTQVVVFDTNIPFQLAFYALVEHGMRALFVCGFHRLHNNHRTTPSGSTPTD